MIPKTNNLLKTYGQIYCLIIQIPTTNIYANTIQSSQETAQEKNTINN